MRLDDFLGVFFPATDEPIFIRGFSPKELPEPQREPPYGAQVNRQTLSTNQRLQQQLKELNQRVGLYFIPNSGGPKIADITRVNAAFCEIDTIPLTEQHDLYDLSPLPPAIRVETRKSVHAYWPLAPGVDNATWAEIQCGLIQFFKSDAGLKNVNRVMRLPFFNHLFWDGEFHYKRVEIHTFDGEAKYTASELLYAYPYTPPPVPVYSSNGYNGGNGTNANSALANSIEAISAELRRRITQHPTFKTEADGIHGTAQGICHNAVHGRTAIMLNLRTGAVFCHAGCDYWTIAGAFGLSRPQGRNGHHPRLVNRRQPTTQTGRFLQEYVYGQGGQNGQNGNNNNGGNTGGEA